jgi:transketolase
MSKRAVYLSASETSASGERPLATDELAAFESLDALYRSLCALLYNYVPTSGHPGGSISSGRFVAGLVFDSLDYDLAAPGREDADILSYAAGHKVMGLYAMWALRDEIARLAAPGLVAKDDRDRLRLEDLLGFRRNPTTKTPLFVALHARALDGHPTPATPFVRVASGASGVGLASSIGLAIAARDRYGENCPRIHIAEGEGGLTPGRASEALAAAGTASLANVMVHVDYNQASIDSERVCRDGDVPGDYVQWNPGELFHLHDWNVVEVADGHDFHQIVAAQRRAIEIDNGQPTAVVYRTRKGWKYGIEGRASHGAGHKLCSAGFHQIFAELGDDVEASIPTCDLANPSCVGPNGDQVREACFWAALQALRRRLETDLPATRLLAARLLTARERLERCGRAARPGAPRVETVYELATRSKTEIPPELVLEPGVRTSLRETLGRSLQLFNRASGGSMLVASADLLGSTNLDKAAADFAPGFWNAVTNPEARLLSIGGICEDAIAGVLSGVSAYGNAIGVGSSYGAFMAPLGHIAARLHAIGAQARCASSGVPYRSLILICAHAGLATGEDGPTHADVQALQLFQENFPASTAVTLTPWEPQELWPLLATALAKRPAVIVPFVTRPEMTVLDRAGLGLAAPAEATSGVYLLRRSHGTGDVTIVLQESAVAYAFVTETLPMLEADSIDARVYYVASAELFDTLSPECRRAVFPEADGTRAMGITGFTLSTMYRWVRSDAGREATLHPYRRGRYLGSGPGDVVLAEAGLDGASQFVAIKRYLDGLATSKRPFDPTEATTASPQ